MWQVVAGHLGTKYGNRITESKAIPFALQNFMAQETQPSQHKGIQSPVCMSEPAATLVPAQRTEKPDSRNFKASANQAADIEMYPEPWLEEVWTRATRQAML